MLFGAGIQQATLGASTARSGDAAVDAIARPALPGRRADGPRVTTAGRACRARDERAHDRPAARVDGSSPVTGSIPRLSALPSSRRQRRSRAGAVSPHLTPALTWPPTGAPPSLYRRLPESTTRYRALLSGQPAPALPEDGQVESALLLEHAWTLFLSIERAVRALPAVKALADTTDAPISVAYEWPEELRVSIEVFEALLGKLWSAHPEPGAEIVAPAHADHRHRLRAARPPLAALRARGRVRRWLAKRGTARRRRARPSSRQGFPRVMTRTAPRRRIVFTGDILQTTFDGAPEDVAGDALAGGPPPVSGLPRLPCVRHRCRLVGSGRARASMPRTSTPSTA